MLKLSIKEANDLADEIERNGNNADTLRSIINDVDSLGNGHLPFHATAIDDEEYITGKRAQTEIEDGTALECVICHDKFDHLLSGTCEVCFKKWMLDTKPKSRRLPIKK